MTTAGKVCAQATTEDQSKNRLVTAASSNSERFRFLIPAAASADL